ncbi:MULTISPECIES: hypothetical protein [unclassified Novosphingobium]|uniref:hypothetical protein n=1 Tax=unclassified Novosphingobium TaxID=2644732 RepID=UPI000EEA38CA|nr:MULTISPECIES: hypothetical protein [unclassified Novosphingobium]HCF25565.1 hypothetical protein [Novosphingobium sp.]HQV03857.1 hypothetical protein [Novosphingobium sp.]
MPKSCYFEFETSPEIVEYSLDEFQDHFANKCVPGLFTAVQKAKAQLDVIDQNATRDVDVDIDLTCKVDDDFVPDCDGTVTIKLD